MDWQYVFSRLAKAGLNFFSLFCLLFFSNTEVLRADQLFNAADQTLYESTAAEHDDLKVERSKDADLKESQTKRMLIVGSALLLLILAFFIITIMRIIKRVQAQEYRSDGEHSPIPEEPTSQRQKPAPLPERTDEERAPMEQPRSLGHQ